ncbi:MAG: preprotein translocase subunit SecG [Acetobacteraceae bacterium]
MATILLIVELFITLALIGIVLIQRSEGGGLGIGGGGGGGMGSFMGGRGTANLLTRTTAILAAAFMGLALVLAILGRGGNPNSILNVPPPPAHTATAPAAPQHPAPSSPLPGGPEPATLAPIQAAPPTPAQPAPANPSAASPVTPTAPQVPTK